MKKAFIRLLRASGIEFLRVLWCDNANVIRCKAIHADSVESHMDSGAGISEAQQSVPVMYDGISPGSGLTPAGEVRLIPDWDSFRILPHSPGHAMVMGDMYQQGNPWPYCPRDFLKRMVKRADEAGLRFLASFENEFYLLKSPGEELIPADNTPFASGFSMDQNRETIGEIVRSLQGQGMKIAQYYAESGPGQQEITVGCDSPMNAADNQVAFRETVRAVAAFKNHKASFLPKIFPDKSGNGCHLHLSLWNGTNNAFCDSKNKWGVSNMGSAFMGGILHHLPALMAVTTPTVNSFRRIKPHFWCGAFRCWGLDNREAALRVITDPQTGNPDHFEVKTMDASSNPYLALGCIIAAGLDGIEKNLSPGAPVNSDPGDFTEQELSEAGINPLPQDLREPLELLSKDPELTEALGGELSRAYISVKKNEYGYMRNMSIQEEVGLLLDKY